MSYNKINFWSFIISLVCILLFYLSSFSDRIGNSIFGIHSLKIILFIAVMNLVLVAIGFIGVQGWKSMLRSIITLIITFGMVVFLTFVLFVGSLLQAS